MNKKAFLFKHKRPASSEYLVVVFGRDIEDAREKAVKELEVHRYDEFECVQEKYMVCRIIFIVDNILGMF